MNRHNGIRQLILTAGLIYIPACFISLCAQPPQEKKIELLNADVLESDERLGKNAARLIGNVRFKHADAIMYCDSAYRFTEENRFDAFGNVRIVQNDSLNITGNKLIYTGRNALAVMQQNVMMNDGKMTLRTQELQYNLNSNQAVYSTGAEITDAENVLTSRRGIYHSPSKMLFFRDSVKLDNPRYRLYADSLKYQTVTKTAYFTGYTLIESKTADSSRIYCTDGWYETQSGQSWFGINSSIVSKEQTLFADSLFYDSKAMTASAFHNIKILDPPNKAVVTGQRAWYDENKRFTVITRRAIMAQQMDHDSLFLHADTLFAAWDSNNTQRHWHAYRHCRIFKSDLQAKTDSLVYHSTDSTFRMYGAPVIWSASNQLSSDSVHILTRNQKIDKMLLFNSAFIASAVDSMRFDQIRGKNMTGYFEDSKLQRIEVDGNGQSIYHVKNRKGRLTGVNRADCTAMSLLIKEDKVSVIKLYQAPDATLFPLADTSPEEFRLKGFTWQIEKRPLNKEDIFEWK
jgi:lipopolysaccharide export system protein LptA